MPYLLAIMCLMWSKSKPGSIKGDVKRKHFSLGWREGEFSDIQPLASSLGAEIRSSLIGFTFALRRWSVLTLHKPGGGEVPTMVLSETRAEARHHGFVGLSEGAGCPTHSRFSNVWENTMERPRKDGHGRD